MGACWCSYCTLGCRALAPGRGIALFERALASLVFLGSSAPSTEPVRLGGSRISQKGRVLSLGANGKSARSAASTPRRPPRTPSTRPSGGQASKGSGANPVVGGQRPEVRSARGTDPKRRRDEPAAARRRRRASPPAPRDQLPWPKRRPTTTTRTPRAEATSDGWGQGGPDNRAAMGLA